MEIILGWSVGDEEEWDANGMDEDADHDLGNVQSKNSVTNSLFDDGEIVKTNGQMLRLFTLCSDNIPCDHPWAFGRYQWRWTPRSTRQR